MSDTNQSKDMVVAGVVVPFATLENAFAWTVGQKFTLSDLQSGLAGLGVKPSIAYRAADRLLQQKRKAGLVSYSNKSWKKAGS